MRVERDPRFWDAIAALPEVSPWVFAGTRPASLAPIVSSDRATPLASENGGVIFWCLDQIGFVLEMHTLYRPDGWGREVALNGRAFMAEGFRNASLIITHEQEGNWRSRPPKSHGWTACGDFRDAGFPHRLRLWSLTRESWQASPVGRRVECQQRL